MPPVTTGDWIQIVQSLGFPVVLIILIIVGFWKLFWPFFVTRASSQDQSVEQARLEVSKVSDACREEVTRTSEAHRKEMSEAREQFMAELASQRTMHTAALSEQRQSYAAMLTEQRRDFMNELAQQRGDSTKAVREQSTATSATLKSLTDAVNQLAGVVSAMVEERSDERKA